MPSPIAPGACQPMTGLELAAVLVIYAVIGTAGLILMKRGLPADVSIFPVSVESLLRFASRCLNARLIVGFVFYAMSFALSLVILAARPLNFVYPLMTAAAYVGALAAAIIVQGERVSAAMALGIVLIGAGVILVARSP